MDKSKLPKMTKGAIKEKRKKKAKPGQVDYDAIGGSKRRTKKTKKALDEAFKY